MLDLTAVQAIIGFLNWTLTLGKSDLEHVQKETDELIRDLSASLTNLWDVTVEVTKFADTTVTKEDFEGVYDYFYQFFLGDENVSSARTHCGHVERDVGRVKFRLAKALQTDIGEWTEVDQKLSGIIHQDGRILTDYDNCIDTLHDKLRKIQQDFDSGAVAAARESYSTLKRGLRDDIEQLRLGVKAMDEAINHVRTVSG